MTSAAQRCDVLVPSSRCTSSKRFARTRNKILLHVNRIWYPRPWSGCSKEVVCDLTCRWLRLFVALHETSSECPRDNDKCAKRLLTFECHTRSLRVQQGYMSGLGKIDDNCAKSSLKFECHTRSLRVQYGISGTTYLLLCSRFTNSRTTSMCIENLSDLDQGGIFAFPTTPGSAMCAGISISKPSSR